MLILGDPGREQLYASISIVLVIVLVIGLIERYLSYIVASILFNTFIYILLFAVNTPMDEFLKSHTLMYLAFPVVTASLLLRPWAGYVVAAVTSIVVSVATVYLNLGIPNIPALFFLVAIALVIQQSTSGLERAVEREQTISRALRESEDKYHRLIDLLPVGLMIQHQGILLFINPTGAKLFGAASPEELIGSNGFERIHPDYRELLKKRSQNSLAGRTNVEPTDVKLVRIDGTTFDAEASGLPFRYEDRASILVVFTDTTERKQAREAITLQNQRIQEVSQKLLDVQEQEKHLLAAELHDDLGQSLTSLKLILELSNRARSSSNRKKKLEEARELVSELMGKVRNLSLDLRPAMLDDFGLFAALRWLFDRFQSRTGISVHCNYDLDNKQRFEPHVETAAFRIIQEALTNVARHASVREAQVTISTDRALSIEVADQGTGFDVAQTTPKTALSAGLSGMQERARLLGGYVKFHSEPGSGTRVTAEIPLPGGAQ